MVSKKLFQSDRVSHPVTRTHRSLHMHKRALVKPQLQRNRCAYFRSNRNPVARSALSLIRSQLSCSYSVDAVKPYRSVHGVAPALRRPYAKPTSYIQLYSLQPLYNNPQYSINPRTTHNHRIGTDHSQLPIHRLPNFLRRATRRTPTRERERTQMAHRRRIHTYSNDSRFSRSRPHRLRGAVPPAAAASRRGHRHPIEPPASEVPPASPLPAVPFRQRPNSPHPGHLERRAS